MLVNFLLVNFLLVNYILVNFLLVNIGEWFLTLSAFYLKGPYL